MYQVDVQWAPAHELIVSLAAFANTRTQKMTDLGAAWAAKVKRQLHPTLLDDLAEIKDGHLPGIMQLLVPLCPGTSVDEFLAWVRDLSPGFVYEKVAQHLHEGSKPLPADLRTSLAYHADLLARWNEQYFRKIDPAILAGLAAEAEARRLLVTTQSPQEAVEAATNGIVFEPNQEIQRVILVPMYHHRPLNHFLRFGDSGMFIYSTPDAPTGPSETHPGLMRILRALSDESRIKILRYVAQDSRSFMEIVKHSGLALSTVHHHLAALMAAGLLRIHVVSLNPGTGQNTTRYTFRPTAVDGLGPRLIDLIQGGAR